jgi:hypothetical protein
VENNDLHIATPGFDKSKMNVWRVQYIKSNLCREVQVSGDTLDLHKWIGENLDAIIISIIVGSQKPSVHP